MSEKKYFFILSLIILISSICGAAETGLIYAGGSVPGVVYRYLGGTSWEQVSPELGGAGGAVLCLYEYNGCLYAGTMTGSMDIQPYLGTESPISKKKLLSSMSLSCAGGKVGQVWRYEGGTEWKQVGSDLDNQVCSLIAFRGDLYAGTARPGRLYRYESDTKCWVLVDGCELLGFLGFRSLYVWNDLLYIGDIIYDKIGRYDGNSFILGVDLGGSCIWDFEVYDSNLYASAYESRIHRSSDGNSWETIRDFQECHSWELEKFQDYLYVTTGPNLEMYNGSAFSPAWTVPDGSEIISMIGTGDTLILGTGKEAGSLYFGIPGVSRVYRYDGSWACISGDTYMGGGIQSLYAPPLVGLTKVDNVGDGNLVWPGDEITYTIHYSYPLGPNLPDINDVNIIDHLPDEVEPNNPSDPNYSPDDSSYTWWIGTVSPGDSNYVTLTVEVNCPEQCGTIENYCEIKSGDFILNIAYEHTPVHCPTLTMVDDVNDGNCVAWGDQITYSTFYDVNGYNTTNVKITDDLPYEVNYVSSLPEGDYNEVYHTVTWDINELELGDSNCVTLTVEVNHPEHSIITNCCEMTGYCMQNAITACEDTLACAFRLDFNYHEWHSPAETESGFTDFIIDYSGSVIGGIKIELFGNLQDRRRYEPNGVAREQIYRDFICGLWPGEMKIVLTGMGANQECEVTIYAYDWCSTSAPPREADWYANRQYLLTTRFAGDTNDTSYPPPEGENYAFVGTAQADDTGKLTLKAFEGPNNGSGQFCTSGSGGGGFESFAFCNALVVLPTSDFVPVTSAYNPVPADKQIGISLDTNLSWTAGSFAAEHDVYFGTNFDEVNEASAIVYQGAVTEPCYPLTNLNLNTTYYWRIDEVNDFLIWPAAKVWEFTITDFISIDDFEGYLYSDPEGSSACPYYDPCDMRYVWLDGHVQKNPQGGCGGGMDDYNPMALEGETGRLPGSRIIRTDAGWTGYGLSYYYNNDDVDNEQFPPESDAYEDRYSEILRFYPEGRNLLTANGKVSEGTCPAIEISYLGSPTNGVDPVYDRMYVVLEDWDVDGDYRGDDAQIDNPDPNAAQVIEWTQWAIELSDFTDENEDLDLDNIRCIRIGFGKRFHLYDDEPPGGEGTVVFDKIRLYGPHCVLSKRSEEFTAVDFGPPGNPPGDCIVNFQDHAVLANDWLAEDDIIPTTNPTDDNLIAYWPMNEGTGVTTEDVIGYNNGTMSDEGVTWVSPGVVGGSCIHVDGGAGSRVTIPNWNPLESGEMTISCWVRWSGDNERNCSQGLVCQRDGWCSSDLMRFMFELDTPGTDGAVSMRQYSGADTDVSTDGGAMLPFIGKWAHVAVTYDGEVAAIYINGQGVVDGNFFPGNDPNSEMTIGNTNTIKGWSNCPQTLNGDIDEVRIYNRALLASEVAYLADFATNPEDGILYVPVPSPAELYSEELKGERIIDFHDYEIFAEMWLEEELWP